MRCRSRRCLPRKWRERRTGSPLRFLPLSTWLMGNDKRIQSYMTGKWGRKQCLWLDQRSLWSWCPWTNGNVFPSLPTTILCPPDSCVTSCCVYICDHCLSFPCMNVFWLHCSGIEVDLHICSGPAHWLQISSMSVSSPVCRTTLKWNSTGVVLSLSAEHVHTLAFSFRTAGLWYITSGADVENSIMEALSRHACASQSNPLGA